MKAVIEVHSTTFRYSRNQITDDIKAGLERKGYTIKNASWDKSGKNLMIEAIDPEKGKVKDGE
jgi:hypothetical protein